MATKGLGKGLGALISMFDDDIEGIQSSHAEPTAQEKVNTVMPVKLSSDASPVNSTTEIDTTLIDNNIDQPRKVFDQEKLQELADSIKANGIIQPILLNRVGTRYMIVAGERRWRAAKLAGLKTIPAIVRTFTKAQVAEIAIVENLQRHDLNEIELARGIKKLMEDFGLTQELVSARIGKNRASVANTLRLLALPAEVIEMLETNSLSVGHAKCLVALSNKSLIVKLAKRCVDEQLTVRALESLITGIHNTKSNEGSIKKSENSQSPELREFTRYLNAVLGTKVIIQGNDRKGNIVVGYYSKDDLARIRSKVRM